MKDPQEHCEGTTPDQGEGTVQDNLTNRPANTTRRSFMGKMGIGSAAAVALAAVPLEPLIEGKHGEAEASVVSYNERGRAGASYNYRVNTAQVDDINPGVLPDNGDYARFSDYSGSWSKCLPHTALGIVSPTAYQSFIYALSTGRFQDFQNIIVGNPGGPGFTGTLNGPMAALAFDLEGLDSHATVIPPAPSVSSAQTAAELVEHYWATLMRDVNFTDYATNSIASQASADLNNLSYVRSANSQFPYPVTPQNLFRGKIYSGDGALQGPYVSQFMLQPTMLGVQPLSQMYQRIPFGEPGRGRLPDRSPRVPTAWRAASRPPSVWATTPPTASCAWDATWRHTLTWTRSIRRTS